MKYGILGDIHANLNALRSVLAALDAEGVDEVVSVGDVVRVKVLEVEVARKRISVTKNL